MTALEYETADTVVRVPLGSIRMGPSYRERGVDAVHVELLVSAGGDWPPILLSRQDHRVIDGLHRVHAARALGLDSLECTFFAQGRDLEYLEFLRRNTAHGLPLTLRDRELAARTVLGSHDDWSDRRIGRLCGLSAGTVAKIRLELERSGGGDGRTSPPARRIGKDGRSRPVDGTATRERIAAALSTRPGASLRSIASEVGASPETVRRVRAALGNAGRTGASQRLAAPVLRFADLPRGAVRPHDEWKADASLLATDEGRSFVKWFRASNVDVEWKDHLAAVPLSRVYEVVDEARRRSEQWREFATVLQQRVERRVNRY